MCLQDAAGGLRGLTRLQELCLADPFFGDCPVTGLCNYQTYMLAALPHLTNLDTLVIAEETRAAAATTYAKKRLYYSMRTRTLQRAAGDLVQQAKAGLQVGCGAQGPSHCGSGQDGPGLWLACKARSPACLFLVY